MTTPTRPMHRQLVCRCGKSFTASRNRHTCRMCTEDPQMPTDDAIKKRIYYATRRAATMRDYTLVSMLASTLLDEDA